MEESPGFSNLPDDKKERPVIHQRLAPLRIPAVVIDLCLIIVCTMVYVNIAGYPEMARIFPRLVLVMIIAAAFFDIINTIKQNRQTGPEEKKGSPSYLKVVYMAFLMLLFFFSMLLFGYLPGTLLFLLFSGWTLGYRKIKILTISSACITLGIYLIFGIIMKAFLPRGILFSFFGG